MKADKNLCVMLGQKLRRLREDAGMSQQKLASLAGMVQPMINRFETGERRITVEHAMKLAPALGISAAELLPPNIAAVTARPRPAITAPAHDGVMPVLGADGAPVDETPVPPVLATARERYAIYMPDASMAPRYAAGTLLHVAPHKPAAPGRGVVLAPRDGQRIVREWLSADDTHIHVRRYGKGAEAESYSLADIAAVHSIVGTVEP